MLIVTNIDVHQMKYLRDLIIGCKAVPTIRKNFFRSRDKQGVRYFKDRRRGRKMETCGGCRMKRLLAFGKALDIAGIVELDVYFKLLLRSCQRK